MIAGRAVSAESVPARLRGVRIASPDLLDFVLFFPGIWLACALGISLRIIGPLFVVVPTGVCLAYAILRRVMPPRLLGGYLIICIIAGVSSYYRLFPRSWQVHFMHEAIVRQLVPMFGFFAIAWASKAYFRMRFINGDVLFGAPLFLGLGLLIAPVVMFVQGVGYQGRHSLYEAFAFTGAFINSSVIALFFIMAGIFLAKDWRHYAGLAATVTIAAFSHFVQFRLFVLVVLGAAFGFPARKLALAVAAALPLIYIVSINFIPQIMLRHPNEGIRLAFVADALSSAVDTYGLGIGYGTESVRWVYRFPDMPDFKFLPDAKSMTRDRMLEALSNGVENSFVQALLRTGVVGCALLVAALFAAFPPAGLPQPVRNHAGCVFAMVFIGLFVNASLETPLSAAGHGFAYGYLLALRGYAKRRDLRMIGAETVGTAPNYAAYDTQLRPYRL